MMDLVYALYELREALDKSEEMLAYKKAQVDVENDLALQILLGEFEKCKENSSYLSEDEQKRNLERAQHIKIKIFDNQHFMRLKEIEKSVNQMRQNIAEKLFPIIDTDIAIEGRRKLKKENTGCQGGCGCGS